MILDMKIKPQITLVGAGPGDPELLTIKGLKAIQSADVILYDALVNSELLKEAPAHALKVFVGKRAKRHRYPQERINMMLVQYALTHGHVVRLKGGDSFVFGRGHEEMSYASVFDIPVDIIPGISSCIAVPELQGVPLTSRGVNESFWVLTGTTKAGKLSEDIRVAVQSTATIVILMGIRKIEQIAQIFCEAGKKDLPAMVVQNGSLENQRMVVGTANDIAQKVQEHKIGTPGIIVFGEVVALHQNSERLNFLKIIDQHGKT